MRHNEKVDEPFRRAERRMAGEAFALDLGQPIHTIIE